MSDMAEFEAGIRAAIRCAPEPLRTSAMRQLDLLVRSRDRWKAAAEIHEPNRRLDSIVAELAARAEHPEGIVPTTWPPDEATPPDPIPDTEEEAVPPSNAGTAWVDLYPTSRSVDDLVEPFRRSVRRFLAELNMRGCTARIQATLRPPERAWLMHVAWLVARGELAPELAPEHEPRIPIVWSVAGAKEMVAAYDLAYRPSLTSRHIQGRAIDMTITGWSGTAADLYALGATFGVRKLVSDPPHWSDDGR